MKAVLYPAKANVGFGELPQPSPGTCEVLVKVMASGICHIDIDVLHGR